MTATFPLRILDRAEVRRCLAGLDPVGITEAVLRQHAAGTVRLPAEGYLPWHNSVGGSCRSLAMLGALTGDPAGGRDGEGNSEGNLVTGLKVINAATSNPARGLERASGVGLIFDSETAQPVLLAEVGLISALRTAAYTVVSVRHLGPLAWNTLALIGAGTQAWMHLELLAAEVASLRWVRVHDVEAERAAALVARATARYPGIELVAVEHAAAAVTGAQVVVTVTASTRPYLGPDELEPGTFVAHVSLDDVDARVLIGAEGLFVDDVGLVRDNPRRILGALMATGQVLPPDGDPSAPGRPLDGTLGDVLTGIRPAIRPGTGVVVSNPFGMAVLDVGLLDAVRREAERLDLGRSVDLLPAPASDRPEVPSG